MAKEKCPFRTTSKVLVVDNVFTINKLFLRLKTQNNASSLVLALFTSQIFWLGGSNQRISNNLTFFARFLEDPFQLLL